MCGVDAAIQVYSLVITTVLYTRSLRSNPYFILAISLGVNECGFLLITVVYVAPSMIAQTQIGGMMASNMLGAMATSVFWFPMYPLYMSMAVNRYVAICRGHGSYKLNLLKNK